MEASLQSNSRDQEPIPNHGVWFSGSVLKTYLPTDFLKIIPPPLSPAASRPFHGILFKVRGYLQPPPAWRWDWRTECIVQIRTEPFRMLNERTSLLFMTTHSGNRSSADPASWILGSSWRNSVELKLIMLLSYSGLHQFLSLGPVSCVTDFATIRCVILRVELGRYYERTI